MTKLYKWLTVDKKVTFKDGVIQCWPRNPEGPQAAALLREMLAGLIAADGFFAEIRRVTPDVVVKAIAAAREAGVPET